MTAAQAAFFSEGVGEDGANVGREDGANVGTEDGANVGMEDGANVGTEDAAAVAHADDNTAMSTSLVRPIVGPHTCVA